MEPDSFSRRGGRIDKVQQHQLDGRRGAVACQYDTDVAIDVERTRRRFR